MRHEELNLGSQVFLHPDQDTFCGVAPNGKEFPEALNTTPVSSNEELIGRQIIFDDGVCKMPQWIIYVNEDDEVGLGDKDSKTLNHFSTIEALKKDNHRLLSKHPFRMRYMEVARHIAGGCRNACQWLIKQFQNKGL